jgi:DNA-binding response OmpR family regulator
LEPSLLILMVEDDALISIVIQDALEEAGFLVQHASQGDEAEEALDYQAANIAGLVTDIRFGGGTDGWNLARKAREMRPHLPVVYVSGDSAHEHTVQGVPGSIMLRSPLCQPSSSQP